MEPSPNRKSTLTKNTTNNEAPPTTKINITEKRNYDSVELGNPKKVAIRVKNVPAITNLGPRAGATVRGECSKVSLTASRAVSSTLSFANLT